MSPVLYLSNFTRLTNFRLIPLASIISPAALTIEIDQVKPSPTFFSQQIPTLNFTSLSFAAGLSPPAVFGSELAVAQYHWNGPSSAVVNVAQAVAAQGTWRYVFSKILAPMKSSPSPTIDLSKTCRHRVPNVEFSSKTQLRFQQRWKANRIG